MQRYLYMMKRFTLNFLSDVFLSFLCDYGMKIPADELILCNNYMCFCLSVTGQYDLDMFSVAAHFDNGHHAGTVTSSQITEASGICASRTHKDVLYTHNDSGDTHRIFAIR